MSSLNFEIEKKMNTISQEIQLHNNLHTKNIWYHRYNQIKNIFKNITIENNYGVVHTHNIVWTYFDKKLLDSTKLFKQLLITDSQTGMMV